MADFYITNWDEWQEICQEERIDPWEFSDTGRDKDGGDSDDVHYIGDYPKREERNDQKRD